VQHRTGERGDEASGGEQLIAEITVPMAQWAANNGIRKVVTLVSDYAPGLETEKAFIDEFKARGGEITETLRVPLQSPDFAPYLRGSGRPV
jgi:branched-chain amino acid transport system substrate-binding protein